MLRALLEACKDTRLKGLKSYNHHNTVNCPTTDFVAQPWNNVNQRLLLYQGLIRLFPLFASKPSFEFTSLLSMQHFLFLENIVASAL